jgi:hypothetical protein
VLIATTINREVADLVTHCLRCLLIPLHIPE